MQHLQTARGQYYDSSTTTIVFSVFFPPQAKYWNSSVNEVEGTIMDNKGKVVHRLFGKWHEAVYCGDPPSATCIWRASMSFLTKCRNQRLNACVPV